jgi:excisionase family DNA binding protein
MSAKLLTASQVAEQLQVTEHTVYEWLRTGKLRGLKVGRLWRVPQASLDAFLQNGKDGEFDAPLTEAEAAASESAWQDYLAGRDRGATLTQVRAELLGARRA